MTDIGHIMAVFVGGGLGSVARFYLANGLQRWLPGAFPWGTLAVNITGSFVIGILYVLATRPDETLSPAWRLFFAVGFCGGFTTFSTFSQECFLLFRNNAAGFALLYICASVFLSIAAFGLAIYLGRLIR